MILTILIKSIENISHKHSIFFNTVKLNLKCHLKKKSNKKQFNSTPENLNVKNKFLFIKKKKINPKEILVIIKKLFIIF
jgi:hypothetical protein